MIEISGPVSRHTESTAEPRSARGIAAFKGSAFLSVCQHAAERASDAGLAGKSQKREPFIFIYFIPDAPQQRRTVTRTKVAAAARTRAR